MKIDDGALSTGAENYKEFWYTMVGLAGEGQNFDGNGMYVRFQPGGGDQTVSLGASGGTADKLFANAILKPLGTRPGLPGQAPALQARRALLQEHAARPQRGADGPARRRRRGDAGEPAAGGARAMRTAIRKHARDFAFVLGLVLVAALVGGYILSNQRFYLPHWVPGRRLGLRRLQGRSSPPRSRSRRARARPSRSPASTWATSPRSTSSTGAPW